MSYNNVNVNVSGPKKDYTSTYKTYILRGNMSFADQVTEPNVKYVVKYDFDLDGGTVTIPEGCLLEFDGGTVSNGTIEFDNTILIYNQQEEDVLKNITMVGDYEVSAGGKGDKKDNVNGMGKIYLKKNKSFSEQLTQDNTIYVIQYDFDLNNQSVTIPDNCVLQFDGGSISGSCVLNGNNTFINAGLTKIFDTNTVLSGTWTVKEIYPQWFGAKGDGVEDDGKAIEATYNLATLCGATVIFIKGDYASSMSLRPKSNTVTFVSPNTTFTCLRPISTSHVLIISDVTNVKIYFNGAFFDGNNVRSHVVDITRSSNIELYDINVANVAADSPSGSDHDGIYIGDGVHDIKIIGGKVSNVNRNGFSITDAYNVIIDNVSISDVGWTPNPDNPNKYLGSVAHGIDIEPNNMAICHDITIKNCNIKHCRKGGIIIEQGVVGAYIYNNTINDVPSGITTGFGGVASHALRDGLDKYYVKAYDAETGEITIEVADGYEIDVLSYAIFSAGDDAQHMDSKPTEMNNISNCNIWGIATTDNPNQIKVKIKPKGGFLRDDVVNSFTNVPETLQYSYIAIYNSNWTSNIVIEKNHIINVQETVSVSKNNSYGIRNIFVPRTKIIDNNIENFNGIVAIDISGDFLLIQNNRLINIKGASIGANFTLNGNHIRLINNIIKNSAGYPFYIPANYPLYVNGIVATGIVNDPSIANTNKLLTLYANCRIFIEDAYLQSDRILNYGIDNDRGASIKLKNVTVVCNLTDISSKYRSVSSDDMEFCS